jgi:hypothetical protein
MIAFARTQLDRTPLDRTRQPGLGQVVAGWSVPASDLASSEYAISTIESSKAMDTRDLGSKQNTGAAAGFGERTP